jgi:hypothetical protein
LFLGYELASLARTLKRHTFLGNFVYPFRRYTTSLEFVTLPSTTYPLPLERASVVVVGLQSRSLFPLPIRLSPHWSHLPESTVFLFVRLTPFFPPFSLESPSSSRARRDADIFLSLHARAPLLAVLRHPSSFTPPRRVRPLGATQPCLVHEHGNPSQTLSAQAAVTEYVPRHPFIPSAAADLHPCAPAGDSTL